MAYSRTAKGEGACLYACQLDCLRCIFLLRVCVERDDVEWCCAVGENSYLDGVPILAGEGVDGLLLETLLSLGQSLVPMIKADPSAQLLPFPHVHPRLVCSVDGLAVRLGAGPFGLHRPHWRKNRGNCTHFPTAIFASSNSQRRVCCGWSDGDKLAESLREGLQRKFGMAHRLSLAAN